jgi:hypothetical protein
VQDLLADLRDYKRGALGNVHDLEPPYLALLRIAESEYETWEADQLRNSK